MLVLSNLCFVRYSEGEGVFPNTAHPQPSHQRVVFGLDGPQGGSVIAQPAQHTATQQHAQPQHTGNAVTLFSCFDDTNQPRCGSGSAASSTVAPACLGERALRCFLANSFI
jgi:hypothetical protein